MLTSIIQSLSTAFGDLLEAVINAFLAALDMDLSSYLDVFPLLSDSYTLLRGFAVGLTAIIAGKSLATFWFGSVEGGQVKDRPIMILLRTFFAVLGIYWGGYLLEYIVHLGSIPYDEFLNLNGVSLRTTTFDFSNFLTGFLGAGTGLGAAGVILGDLAVSILSLLLTVIIAWNLFKLMVEICERWLMVGILVYTSPLIYCTIPSNSTAGIFRKWVSMFVGSVMQMSLSVMFLKLILSGFNSGSETSFLVKLFMILALCKISQRIDTYLQQLGIGVATTGGSMLDDLITGARSLSSMTRGARRSSILGSSAGSGGVAPVRGRTPFTRGLNSAMNTFRGGGSVREAVRTGSQTYAETWSTRTGAGRAYSAYKREQARRQSQGSAAAPVGFGNKPATVDDQAKYRQTQSQANRQAAGNIAREWAKGSAAGIAMAVAPGLVGDHDTGIAAKKEQAARDKARDDKRAAERAEQKSERRSEQEKREQHQMHREKMQAAETAATTNAGAAADMAREYQSGGAAMPDDIREAAENARGTGNTRGLRNFGDNYREYGIRNEQGNIFEVKEDGDVEPSTNAAASGVAISESGEMTDKCGGRAVSDWMAGSLAEDAVNEDGSRSYGTLPARSDFISQNVRPDREYAEEGMRSAEEARSSDAKAVSGYEKSVTRETGALNAAIQTAEAQLRTLRESGASVEQLEAAENRVSEKQQNLYNAAVSAGEKQVAAAKEKLDSLEARGVSHEAGEYKNAQNDYQRKQEALESYKIASANLQDNRSHSNYRKTAAAGENQAEQAKERLESLDAGGVPHDAQEYQKAESEYLQKQSAVEGYKSRHSQSQGPSRYEQTAQAAASESKNADIQAAGASYDAAQAYMADMLDRTIDSSDVYAKARALNNPQYKPADNEQTRRMAKDVFGPALTDMAPGASVLSIKARDIRPRTDNYGNIEMQGGRMFEISYPRTGGGIGKQVFYNGIASTALPPEFAATKSVFTARDGSHWLFTGARHVTAPPSGRRVNESRALSAFFATIRRRRGR